jgi:hypothetical protein
MEIPVTKEMNNATRLGGPSLADMQAVLRSSGDSQNSQDGVESSSESLRFKVSESTIKRLHPYNVKQLRDSRREDVVKENQEIVKALQKFGGGFYGGFEGLAEKFEDVSKLPSNETPTRRSRRVGTKEEHSAVVRSNNRRRPSSEEKQDLEKES